MEETEIRKQEYELAYLLPLQAGDEGIKRLKEEIQGHIEGIGGNIRDSREPVERRLAYPIKKQRNGYLGFVTFVASPETLKDLDKKCRMNDEILRYLVVRVEERKLLKRKSSAVARRPLSRTTPAVSKEIEKRLEKKEEKKVELEELEKKLEEILEG